MLVRLSQLDASSPLSGLTIYKTQSITKLFFDNLLVGIISYSTFYGV